jgi:hypothetical protein
LSIADDPTGDYREEDGKKIPDYENVQRARLRVDTRKWMAGKLLPKVYGDKMLHTGADGEGPVQVKLALDYSRYTPEQLVQLREARAADDRGGSVGRRKSLASRSCAAVD